MSQMDEHSCLAEMIVTVLATNMSAVALVFSWRNDLYLILEWLSNDCCEALPLWKLILCH